MAGQKLGILFQVLPSNISLFNEKSLVDSGTTWQLDGWVHISPSTVSDDIEQLIMADIENGAQDRIDHIMVNPISFAVLYLEGRITYLQMLDAYEDLADSSITVKGIKFLGKEYTVKTMPQGILNSRFAQKEFTFATINSEGQVV